MLGKSPHIGSMYPCMVYLPTFGKCRLINKPYMDPMGYGHEWLIFKVNLLTIHPDFQRLS